MLIRRLVFSFGVMILSSSTGLAQDYPTRPIRILTGSVGSGIDFVSRLLAPHLLASLGQPVIVDNRGSLISMELVSRASPDGYNLLVAGSSFWIGPLLQKAPYDAVRDFSPVTLLTSSPNVLAVHPSLPVRSVKELIAYAQTRPGELNYGSGPAGSGNHLAAELFKSMTGINIVRVAYKGTGPAVTALVGGEVQLMLVNASVATPHLKSGRLRALAVGSAQPSPLVPGLPTVAASGLQGYESTSPFAMFAPARTPTTVIGRLNREIVRVLNRADVKERLSNDGQQVVGSSPEELAGTIKAEIIRYGKVIKDSGIRVD